MERQFKQIYEKKQPGSGTNKLVFGQTHSQKEDIGEGSGQVTDHGGNTGHYTHKTRKDPMGRNRFGRSPIPPIHHYNTAQNNISHSQFKGFFGQIFSNEDTYQYA